MTAVKSTALTIKGLSLSKVKCNPYILALPFYYFKWFCATSAITSCLGDDFDFVVGEVVVESIHDVLI